jgi:hypothetical protein
MHCPNCGAEVPYNPKLAGKPCSACLPDNYPLVGTTESITKQGGVSNQFARLVGVVLLELTLSMAVILYLARPPREGKTEVDYFYVRCAGCKRKLRYATHKAGHRGQCPRCKHPLFFAAADG